MRRCSSSRKSGWDGGAPIQWSKRSQCPGRSPRRRRAETPRGAWAVAPVERIDPSRSSSSSAAVIVDGSAPTSRGVPEALREIATVSRPFDDESEHGVLDPHGNSSVSGALSGLQPLNQQNAEKMCGLDRPTETNSSHRGPALNDQLTSTERATAPRSSSPKRSSGSSVHAGPRALRVGRVGEQEAAAAGAERRDARARRPRALVSPRRPCPRSPCRAHGRAWPRNGGSSARRSGRGRQPRARRRSRARAPAGGRASRARAASAMSAPASTSDAERSPPTKKSRKWSRSAVAPARAARARARCTPPPGSKV